MTATHALARIHAALVWIVLLPVALYRRVLSPMKRTPTCRFLPTCSEYAIEAVHARGIVVGGALATWRLLRCNPLCRGGYDPVPIPGPGMNPGPSKSGRCGQEHS